MAAASGAVGAVVGQIAKIKGCRVVGITGSSEKSRYVVEKLGFDACLDHRDPALPQRLAEAVPDGIDIYFENVGGAVFDAVWPLLNDHARIPVCGLISRYNEMDVRPGPDRVHALAETLLFRRILMQGFIISDQYGDDGFATFIAEMSAWLEAGVIVAREDIRKGLEQAPGALIGLLQGQNNGKVLIRIPE